MNPSSLATTRLARGEVASNFDASLFVVESGAIMYVVICTECSVRSLRIYTHSKRTQVSTNS